MSVLIKGMNMPKGCHACYLLNSHYYCPFLGEVDKSVENGSRDLRCPLVEAPTLYGKGKWLPIQRGEQGYSAGDFKCSRCGNPNKCYSLTDYCANCGAAMREDEVANED